MIRFLQLVFAVLALGTGIAARGQVIVDTFNRADSTNLGVDWTERTGDVSIVGGMLRGTDTALITYNGPTATNTISADVIFGSGGVQYAALVLGYANDTNNVFVKVQSNSGTAGFDNVFFYYGNNGSGFGTQPSSQAITPFQNGRITLTLSGSTAILSLDTNLDGVIDQTITRSGIPLTNLGTGVGLGFYGVAAIDNFALSAVPEPNTTVLLALGVGVVAVIGVRSGKRRRG